MKINKRKRFFKVSFVFFGMMRDFYKEFKLIKKIGFTATEKKMSPRHDKRAKQLYNLAVDMGGVLIKMCQMFSTRRDVFPIEYVKTLSALQDNVPSVPFDKMIKVIEEQFDDHEKIFKSIDEVPLASASLGQVHKAEFFDGTSVVLKILKPDVEKIIDTDFAILHMVFKIMSNFKIFKDRADFFLMLEEFIRVTGDELNFKREAWLAEKFRDGLKKFSYLKIPYIYKAFSTEKIIVMEYLEGTKISEREKWQENNNDPIKISRQLIEIYIEQIMNMGFVHFDPHPGNILISENNNMILLDFGMAGEISDKMQRNLIDALDSLLNLEYRRFLDSLYHMGFIRKNVNRYAMLPIIEFFMNDVLQTINLDRESLNTVDYSPVMGELVEMMYVQPFTLPIDWAFIGKTIGTLIGNISGLNPDFKIYEEMKPYLDQILRKNSDTILSKGFGSVKKTGSLFLNLPKKIDAVVENLERGYLKIKVDYSEINEKIDEVKEFIIRLVSFTIASASGLATYILYNAQMIDMTYITLVIAIVAFGVTIFYRKKTLKQKIEKMM